MGIQPVRAIGVVLDGRPLIGTLRITHLAIDPEGITRVQLPYRERCYLRVTRRESAL